MIETNRVPASALTRMQLKDWPAGSLVLDPGTKALGLVGHFPNARGTEADQPGFLCLTGWKRMNLQSGDIFIEHDDLELWGISGDDLALSADVEPLDLELQSSLRLESNGAVLVVGRTGMAIAGMRWRESPGQRQIWGLNLLGMYAGIPDNVLIVGRWTLIIKLNATPDQRLAISVGTGT